MSERFIDVLQCFALGAAFIAFGLWRRRELRLGSTAHFSEYTLYKERSLVWVPLILGPLSILLGFWLLTADLIGE